MPGAGRTPGGRAGRWAAVAALALLWPGLATAAAAPPDQSDPQVRGWLAEMSGAAVVAADGFHACSPGAACVPSIPGTSFRTPTGAVSCTAQGPAAGGTFTCMVVGATFPRPAKPVPSRGQWLSNYIAQHDDGWTIGNYADTPRVADGVDALAYGTKLTLSQLHSQSGAVPRLECSSFSHGMICLDHLSGKGFHASRQDFTAFTFPATAP